MKKLSRILALALTLCMAFAMIPAPAHAEGLFGGSPSGGASETPAQTGEANAVMKQAAYFRSGPNKSAAKLTSISEVPKGASITVLEKTNKEYWKISYKNTTGYVYASYVNLTGTTAGGGSASSDPSDNTLGGSGGSSSSSSTLGVTTKTCNFRVDSSTSSAAVAGCKTISSGKQVTILDNSGSYWKVSYNGYTGYIYGPYVKIGGGSSSSSGATATGSLAYAPYTGGSSDRWGTIQVDGTNISASIYCNAIDKKGNFYYNAYSSSYNYIYALSYVSNPIAVIYGHNMRKSGVGLHQLHHVQNAWLGKAKCEYCGKSCSGAQTRVFNINYNGASRWELEGFFEASSSTISSSATRKSIELMAAMQSYRTGSEKQEWIDYMMRYCTSSYGGATLGSISSSDQVMVLVTCADKSGDSYQRMYMLLKAVG